MHVSDMANISSINIQLLRSKKYLHLIICLFPPRLCWLEAPVDDEDNEVLVMVGGMKAASIQHQNIRTGSVSFISEMEITHNPLHYLMTNPGVRH